MPTKAKDPKPTSKVAMIKKEDRGQAEQFIFLLVFVAVLFVLASIFYAYRPDYTLYAVSILAVTSTMFFVKRLVAERYDVDLDSKIWLSGLIFSAVATLFISAFGVPFVVPILNTQEYTRAKTLGGLKKGEVTVKEKWHITMFSSMSFLAIAMAFLYLGSSYSSQPLLIGGAFLVTYTFINLIPYHKFDGVFLAYHNSILSIIFLILAFATLVAVYASFVAGLSMAVVFILFSLVSYRLKLW